MTINLTQALVQLHGVWFTVSDTGRCDAVCSVFGEVVVDALVGYTFLRTESLSGKLKRPMMF